MRRAVRPSWSTSDTFRRYLISCYHIWFVFTLIVKYRQVLEQQSSQFTTDNFSFSARAIIGYFLQPAPPPYATDGEYIRMTDVDVSKRLEELKIFTKQSLNVEQRIEIARQQQAARDAKKMQKDDNSRKEKVCYSGIR